MNAVEMEEAVSALAAQRFDPDQFPFAFREAFGNKATTIKRLRSGGLTNPARMAFSDKQHPFDHSKRD